MTYNVTFDICAIITYLFMLYYLCTRKHTNTSKDRAFLFVIITSIISCFGDFINAYLLNYIQTSNPEPQLWMKIVLQSTMYIFITAHNMLCPLAFLYTVLLVQTDLTKNAKKLWLLAIPFFITLTLIILNPFTRKVFYFDDALIYHRGFLLYVIYGIAVFYVVVSLIFVTRHYADVPKNRTSVLTLFILTCLLGSMLQLFMPTVLIELFVQSVACMFVLFIIENDDDAFNGITKIYNRKAFITDTGSAFASKNPTFVTVIKTANLRSYQALFGVNLINDILRKIAATLIKTSGTNSVYDCDNGNFAIIFSAKQKNHQPVFEERVKELFNDGLNYNSITLQLKAIVYSIEIPKDIEDIETLLALIDTDTDHANINEKCTLMRGVETRFLQREQKIERAIRKALDTKSLKVFFQPIWDRASNKIHSAEALVRLYDEEMGFIPPDEFIPIAERNNSIIEIGEFVFEEAVKLFGQRHIHQYGIRFIEVNMSPVQFMQKNLAETFRTIMERHEVNAPAINLEITESLAIDGSETFTNTMNELRDMGFTFSLDDYGTGYSNASNIFNLDFDIIKLDKSILWKADQKASAKIILRNTIQMIKEMNLKIVMEGVETDAQKQTVSNLGCDYIQGFYFSKPMDADQFIDYCKKFNKI